MMCLLPIFRVFVVSSYKRIQSYDCAIEDVRRILSTGAPNGVTSFFSFVFIADAETIGFTRALPGRQLRYGFH